ncbi:glutamate-5-semialdehyde dehydrogenase [Alkalibacterium subtropicum]|uniref:Gamma-glutamyl phosphate reductase n=1 Tax=Alkalibacterium subtropicum TaxID=753702 RepID=A0A1I1JR29_9LACT|nr:glutamate-5-semialdehyde dehydrogenase [Alkalibacterium subtropicum]SFC50402.1 glutamate-5-semialdehyde dehydrogenase [Alkalibacterium subtropicum]
METLIALGKKAKQAERQLAQASSIAKNEALILMAEGLLNDTDKIIEANKKDTEAAKENGISESLLDRLTLTQERVEAMAQGLKDIAKLPDPIGLVESMWTNDAGLKIGKQSVPLGVIGIIYEARPNVTSDAAGLCFKSGNVVILRGGKEAFNSNLAVVTSLRASLEGSTLPETAIQLVEDTSRDSANEMMKLNRYLDVLIPRGGANLIKAVVENATVPVIETGTGNCHVYIDQSAQLEMATDIIVNAKTDRPSVCNAAETLLIHKDVAEDYLPVIEEALNEWKVELRADEASQKHLKAFTPATEADWETEYLDYILAVKVVDSLDEAIEHINRYSTGHSEAIVTNDYFAGQRFHREVDSAAVYVNASTRYTDGFEFGFGAEIGISTQKLHARGPMGLPELTSSKYIIFGEGQTR